MPRLSGKRTYGGCWRGVLSVAGGTETADAAAGVLPGRLAGVDTEGAEDAANMLPSAELPACENTDEAPAADDAAPAPEEGVLTAGAFRHAANCMQSRMASVQLTVLLINDHTTQERLEYPRTALYTGSSAQSSGCFHSSRAML